MNHFRMLLSAVLLLVSCTDNDGEPAVMGAVAEPQTPGAIAAGDYAEFDTTFTIRDVMNTLIDPNADALWNAVRFEIDEAGEHEVFPVTDADWDLHRRQAIAMIEGANALMIPGRRVAPEGATTEFPEYEYQPAEVEQKLREDRLSWLAFNQGFQASVRDVISAIDARNVDRFSEAAGFVDAACEACHSQYWYRTGQ
jgi:hypothetical protein